MSRKLGFSAMAIGIIAMPFSSIPAAAEDEEPDYARSGYYIGAGVEGAVYTDLEDDLEDTIPLSGVGFDANAALGFNLFIGYRIHPNISAELELEIMPQSDVDFSVAGLGSARAGEIKMYAVTTNLKAFLSTGWVQPFVLVGVGLARSNFEDHISAGIDEDETGFAARFGGGLEAYATEQIVLWARSTYLLSEADILGVDTNYVSFGVGILLRF